MPRLFPLLPAALFLAGFAAARFRGADSQTAVRPPEPGRAASTSKSDPVSNPTTAAGGEEDGFTDTVGRATLAEIIALWEAIDEKAPANPFDPSEGARAALWRRLLLVERWTELDTPGALAAVKKRGGDFRLLAAVYRSWAVRDPDAGREAIKGELGDDRLAAAGGWLSAWAEKPAELARRAGELKWLNVSGLEERHFRRLVSMDLLRKAHAADREGMMALSGWLPPWFDGVLRDWEWRAAWTGGAEKARAALETMTIPDDDIPRLAWDLAPLFRTRPEEAMDLVERLIARSSDPQRDFVKRGVYGENLHWKNTSLVNEMVNTIAVNDPERVAALFRGNVNAHSAQLDILSALNTGLIRTNPAGALRIAATLPGVSLLYSPIPASTPRLEPAAALAAVRDAEPSWLRDRWLDQALLELPPAEASAWVDALPEGEVRSSARLTLEHRDLPEGERALLRAVSQFPGDTLDASSQERITAVVNEAVPGADISALARGLASLPEGAGRNQAVERMTMGWTDTNTAGAAAWTESLADGPLRAAAATGLITRWTGEDPTAASAWVDALPAGPAREAAAGQLSTVLAAEDPGSALRWAASLTDPRARQERLSAVALRWAGFNASAAAAGVRAVPGLTDADRAFLLHSLPSAP